jgi:hypothetical protein
MTGAWSTPYDVAAGRRVDLAAVRAMASTPGTLLGSALASWRYDRSTTLRFPVRASARSRVRRHRTSDMDLGGHLYLGHWPDASTATGGPSSRTAGPVVDARTVLDLHAGSRFTTGGWVVVGGGSEVVVGTGASVHLGGGCILNAHVRIIAMNAVHVGNDCAISWGVQLLDDDLHRLTIAGKARPHGAPIHLGDRVWLGTGATVLKGVAVGDGAVVAAGSVVTSDVPDRALVAGVPAKVIATDAEWY